jgi:ATP-dependent RNA helicase RhlE
MKFDRYPISEDIKKNLSELGFRKPTDIQYKSIPSILKGEDVLAVAQTGTGKTLAFAIPVIDRIHSFKRSKRAAGIKCLVMVPTRELAMQIGDVFSQLSRHTRVSSFALYGGVEQDAQIKQLQAGIDVLIATPGRMFDLISQGHIKIGGIQTLVLDEADRMLDAGFIRDIQSVKQKLPGRHQTLFFSATIDKAIKKLAYSQVRSTAIRIQISPEDPVSKNVSHFVLFVEMDDKRFFLQRFIDDHPESRIIVFVRTRVRAERVVKAMARAGIEAAAIHGEKDQAQRTRVMEDFKAGARRILVATDVSARGIDIPDVHFVINYDLPVEPENYVHRIGRTGRGFKKGVAIAFCSREEKARLEAIQERVHKKIDVIQISKKDYARAIDRPAVEMSVEDLIRENEAWEKQKRKKKKGRRQG